MRDAVTYRAIRARRRAETRLQIAEAQARDEVVLIDGDGEAEAIVGGVHAETGASAPRRRRRRVARRLVSASIGRRVPRRPSENWDAHDRLWSLLNMPLVPRIDDPPEPVADMPQ
ncbi:hypothetical protein V502_09177 [Pseudogymnoascus sp. VKM F-4520 (FW-2644)]|nr:hypothetical protein V502_09177 [Pseudogymnoascus sp. VKM F-4520 (FW-2644)]